MHSIFGIPRKANCSLLLFPLFVHLIPFVIVIGVALVVVHLVVAVAAFAAVAAANVAH